jgi:hypothetical protein
MVKNKVKPKKGLPMTINTQFYENKDTNTNYDVDKRNEIKE